MSSFDHGIVGGNSVKTGSVVIGTIYSILYFISTISMSIYIGLVGFLLFDDVTAAYKDLEAFLWGLWGAHLAHGLASALLIVGAQRSIVALAAIWVPVNFGLHVVQLTLEWFYLYKMPINESSSIRHESVRALIAVFLGLWDVLLSAFLIYATAVAIVYITKEKNVEEETAPSPRTENSRPQAQTLLGLPTLTGTSGTAEDVAPRNWPFQPNPVPQGPPPARVNGNSTYRV